MNRTRIAHALQYGIGFVVGICIGVACMDVGMRQARTTDPAFPVISSEPDRPTYTTPLAP